MNKYSTEKKTTGKIDLYFKMVATKKKTVRELGYGSATGFFAGLEKQFR